MGMLGLSQLRSSYFRTTGGTWALGQEILPLNSSGSEANHQWYQAVRLGRLRTKSNKGSRCLTNPDFTRNQPYQFVMLVRLLVPFAVLEHQFSIYGILDLGLLKSLPRLSPEPKMIRSECPSSSTLWWVQRICQHVLDGPKSLRNPLTLGNTRERWPPLNVSHSCLTSSIELDQSCSRGSPYFEVPSAHASRA